jgi:hypothetical protein
MSAMFFGECHSFLCPTKVTNLVREMGLASLIQISCSFIFDALSHARVQYKTKNQMGVFINTMKGHLDTDAFLNLELDRFHSLYFFSLSKLVALSYICECDVALRHSTVHQCPLDYIRKLWQHVLVKMTPAIVFSDRLFVQVHNATALFVHTEFSMFASDFIDSLPA